MPSTLTSRPHAWALIAVILMLGACGGSVEDPMRDQTHVVRGMAVHDYPLRLSNNARFVAELLDVSAGVEAATVLSQQELRPAGQVPLPLELRYRPGELAEDARLAVRVTVYDNGEPFFYTEQPLQIDRRLASEIVEVRLSPTPAAEEALAAMPSRDADEEALPEVPAFESEVPDELLEEAPPGLPDGG
jgi:uncharacterized lipoprotein YbaY